MNYLAKALGELRPQEGMIYNSELPPIASKIIYDSESTIRITQEELDNKIAELQAAEPMRLLRIERDRLLQECDWRDLPSYPGTDQEEWRTYRQALRDLPNNSEPQLNDAGQLINIAWPEKPNGGA